MQRQGRESQTVTSWEYIRDNFEVGDRLAVVIKNQQRNELVQRIATAEHLAGPRYQAWLRFKNAKGNDIYISMNPLKDNARGRTKQDIAVVRHLYLDLDQNGDQALASILGDTQLPKPSYVLNTSIGKYQVVWKVAGFGKEEAEQLQRAMARKYGADRAATDVTRVLRIPGLYNQKYDPPYQVTAEKLSGITCFPSEFRIEALTEPLPGMQTATSPKRAFQGQISQSERDWAETLRRLEQGESPESVRALLEERRSDKHNPAYYATLTVRKALAELEKRRAATLVIDLC